MPAAHFYVELGVQGLERKLARRRRQRLGDQAPIDAHDLRRFVDVRARLRVALRAMAESTFMPWFSSNVSAATWIAATWSSE